MDNKFIQIEWPNGKFSKAKIGKYWLDEAKNQGFDIPTGCLNGSCGACEIEVNGKVIRACISSIKKEKTGNIKVKLWEDPFW